MNLRKYEKENYCIIGSCYKLRSPCNERKSINWQCTWTEKAKRNLSLQCKDFYFAVLMTCCKHFPITTKAHTCDSTLLNPPLKDGLIIYPIVIAHLGIKNLNDTSMGKREQIPFERGDHITNALLAIEIIEDFVFLPEFLFWSILLHLAWEFDNI